MVFFEGELGMSKQGVHNAVKKLVDSCARVIHNVVHLLGKAQHH